MERPMAAGLTAVHKQQLVHRDIKPSNIMASLEDTGAERLGIPISPDRFKVLSIAPLEDDLAGLKSFNGNEGRRFWLYPKKIVKL
jgi:serine/threonine protein kinase